MTCLHGTDVFLHRVHEQVDVPDTEALYVRIVCHGNTANAWNSMAEARIFGTGEPPQPPDTAPVVQFTTPASGTTVSGIVSINAIGHDPDAGTVDGDTMSGEFEIGDRGSGDWSAKRAG